MTPSRSRPRRSKPKRRASALEDRVAVYVDSPLMTHRVRFKRQLFARIHGNYGVYRTWVRLGRGDLDSGCTCPSEWRPCKHVRALERTWRVNRASFFDVAGFLKGLAGRSKAELVETIGRLIARAPEGLAALGVKGFEDEEPEDPDAHDEDGEWR
ncbi:MAG: hypothetical protein HY002_12915 [Candidatus Rokubacteria bacterium]|nr:hypothetical protein [Candidatus Rokubacteria bacterium]